MQFNNRHNLACGSDEFTETTGVYDAAFLGLDKLKPPMRGETGARLYPGHNCENPGVIAEDVCRKVEGAQQHNYILPTRFERGQHMESYLIGERPMSVGFFSNATFKDLQTGQTASLGVAGARFDNGRIDFTMLNFELNSAAERKALPELLLRAKQSDDFSHENLPAEMTGRLKISVDLEKQRIDTTADANASHCYLVRGRHVYEIGGLGSQQLQSGDVILALTHGLLKSLVDRVTRKAYANVVPALQSPSETALAELPDDFFQQEAANQIMGVINASLIEAAVRRGAETVIEPKLSTQKLFNQLSSAQKLSTTEDVQTRIITDAFVVYQMP